MFDKDTSKILNHDITNTSLTEGNDFIATN